MASAGKTTIGRHVYQAWKKSHPNTVIVDGDEIRTLFGYDSEDENYTLDGRKMVAERICDLCAWLDRQEINVVCCTISLFGELHQRNRETFSGYFEVFVDVPMEILRRRDSKNIYAGAERGEMANVIGVDLPFTPPASPDMVLDNRPDRRNFEPLAQEILRSAGVY